MFPSLDTIVEGATVLANAWSMYNKTKVLFDPPRVDTSDPITERLYSNPSMTSMLIGPKDSKNTALTVNTGVQLVRTAWDGSRNQGDFRVNMPLAAYYGRTIRARRAVHKRSHPYGCVGPDCVGKGMTKAMKTVMLTYDPNMVVHAAPMNAFDFGGLSKSKNVGKNVSMIGAGGSVPTDSVDGARLNNSVGLNATKTTTNAKGMMKSASQKSMPVSVK
jgi:hypothetical protein